MEQPGLQVQGHHDPLQKLLPGQTLLLRGHALQLPRHGQVLQEGGKVVVLAGLPALAGRESYKSMCYTYIYISLIKRTLDHLQKFSQICSRLL